MPNSPIVKRIDQSQTPEKASPTKLLELGKSSPIDTVANWQTKTRDVSRIFRLPFGAVASETDDVSKPFWSRAINMAVDYP